MDSSNYRRLKGAWIPMKAKVTEHRVTIPKALLPDVDEVDIRKCNGVIEVAPVDENRHSALAELGRNPGTAETDDGGHAVQTHLTLWKSFYDSGYINVPIYLDECVRPDEGPMTLAIARGEREIQACVIRSANQHGNARIMGGESLRHWFRENYRVKERILVSFDSPSKMPLGGPIIGPSMEEVDTIWELGKDPIPAEELYIRDASVNLDKYIYGE